jgi:cytidyltransferase-like protein
MNVGIFGGTFNPIHLGHLALAETAREALQLDRVVFIPTHQPPHKPAANLASGEARLRMVRLAIRDHPAFAASDIELRRPGPSYSIDTVTALKRSLPQAQSPKSPQPLAHGPLPPEDRDQVRRARGRVRRTADAAVRRRRRACGRRGRRRPSLPM